MSSISDYPGISVVIVNFNSGSLLIECVDSVLSQSTEVIIVDNASSDSSLYDFEEKFSQNTNLKIIRNSKNLGFAKACNIGYSYATGDVILFLNPDCFPDEGANAEMLQALFSNNKVGMVGGLLTNPDGSEQGGGRRAVPTPWRSFVRAFGLYRLSKRWPRLFFDFHLHRQPLPNSSVEVEAISGACMMVKREAVENVGRWDEKYFLHCEDLDWCMRFRQNNWKILFVPTAKLVHKLGACSKTHPFFVEFHKHKGMIHFYRKFFRHQYPMGLMGLVSLGVWLRFSLICVHRSVGLVSGKLKGTHDS